LIERLDEVVLQKVEQCCHDIQKRRGTTNFTWARIFQVLAFASIVIGMIILPPAPHWEFVVPCVAFAAMQGFTFSGWYREMEAYYAEVFDAAHWRTMHWRAQSYSRMFAALAIVISAILACLPLGQPLLPGLSFVFAMFFWLGVLYLQCVIPLPPGAHRQYQEDQVRAAAEEHLVRVPINRK
jgi:hypothetical protein